MPEIQSMHQTRRNVVRYAAWSVPVIAAAVAAPAASASTEETPAPAATFWGVNATVSVVSGNVTSYAMDGSDAEGDPALLPIGSSVVITPEPGVTLEITSSIGLTATLNADGSITAVVNSANLTIASLKFRPKGSSGLGYAITTYVDIEPFTNVRNVKIR